MTEYIEREAISEEIRKYYYKNPPNSSYGEGFDRGLDRAQRAILDAPAADVVPVVHGRWIGAPLCGNDNCKCSECGSWHNIHANLRGKIMQKYCPSCGARMDGGSENG